jgi:hypothetical protein
MDPPNEHNFYAVTVAKEMYHPNPAFRSIVGQMALPTDESLNDRFISVDGFYEYKNHSSVPVFFDDRFFDGSEYTLELAWLDSEGIHIPPDGYTFQVNLWSVSEEYYKYRLTLQKQKDQMKDPFAQPVQVYNNIENGFGAFGAYSQSEMRLVNIE